MNLYYSQNLKRYMYAKNYVFFFILSIICGAISSQFNWIVLVILTFFLIVGFLTSLIYLEKYLSLWKITIKNNIIIYYHGVFFEKKVIVMCKNIVFYEVRQNIVQKIFQIENLYINLKGNILKINEVNGEQYEIIKKFIE